MVNLWPNVGYDVAEHKNRVIILAGLHMNGVQVRTGQIWLCELLNILYDKSRSFELPDNIVSCTALISQPGTLRALEISKIV